jgi:hypothetical protein
MVTMAGETRRYRSLAQDDGLNLVLWDILEPLEIGNALRRFVTTEIGNADVRTWTVGHFIDRLEAFGGFESYVDMARHVARLTAMERDRTKKLIGSSAWPKIVRTES